MASIKLNNQSLNGGIKQLFYNGNEVKTFRLKGIWIIKSGDSGPYAFYFHKRYAEYYIWASSKTTNHYLATKTATPGTSSTIYSATLSGGSWSFGSQSIYSCHGGTEYLPLFSRIEAKVEVIKSIAFHTSPAYQRRYIPLGAMAEKKVIFNQIIYNNDNGTKIGDVVQSMSSNPKLSECEDGAIIGFGYVYKRTTSLTNSLAERTAPRLQERKINELIYAECRHISSIMLKKTRADGTTVDLGDQEYLRTIKDTNQVYLKSAFTLNFKRHNGNLRGESLEFKINLINRNELSQNARVCFAWKLNYVSIPANYSATLNLPGQTITLGAGTTQKSGVVEISGAYHSGQLTANINVTSSSSYLYDNNWLFNIELAPFVVW